MHTSIRILLAATTLTGCAEPLVHVPLGAECEMLDPEECLLPWPSSRFLVDAGTETETGLRVSIDADAMPRSRDDVPLDPETWNRWDGFSAMTSMMARFDGPIDDVASGLPRWDQTDASLEPSSPTLLLDVTSGTPIPIAHFAETEPMRASETRTTLYVRPAARLEEDHTYVVAVRALRAPDGSPVHADAPFAALRDRVPTDSPALEARRDAFETEVFDYLGDGEERRSLLLAWTFHTASGRTAWGDLVSMNEQAQAQVESLDCRVTSVSDRFDVSEGALWVTGDFDVPYFLSHEGDSTDAIDVGDTTFGMARDDSGSPRLMGTRRYRFGAFIPTAAREVGAGPVPIMIYGHGLWGSRDNVLDDGPTHEWSFFAADLAERAGVIVVATDMTGMTIDDLPAVGALLGSRLDDFDVVVDRLLQGTIANLVLGRVFAERCFDDGLLVDGRDVIDRDPEHVVYDGDSLGGIVGPTLAALSPNMHRYTMGVGGISYSLMIPRSTHYPPLERVLSGPFPRAVDRQLSMVMFAQHWDRFDGATFAPHVFGNPLPGVARPDPQVLYQIALADRQTPQVASEVAGRTLGLPTLSCSARMPDGMMAIPSPVGPSERGAWIAFDEGGEPVPDGPTAPREVTPDVHELVRRDPCAQQQVATFLRTGIVECPPDPAHCM